MKAILKASSGGVILLMIQAYVSAGNFLSINQLRIALLQLCSDTLSLEFAYF